MAAVLLTDFDVPSEASPLRLVLTFRRAFLCEDLTGLFRRKWGLFFTPDFPLRLFLAEQMGENLKKEKKKKEMAP